MIKQYECGNVEEYLDCPLKLLEPQTIVSPQEHAMHTVCV